MFCVFPQATSPCPRGCFKRHPLLSHTRIGQHAQAHVLPLLPASLARSGSRSRPQRLLSLAKYRSASRLLPKGEATSQARTPHAPPGSWQIPSLHWLSVSRTRDVIGPCLRPEGGTRLGCTAQEEGGDPEEGHALWRRVFWFGFFSAKEVCFGHASRLPPPLAPLLRPWAHTSGCRLQSAFPCEKCKIFKSQRFAQLVQKERAPVSLGDSDLQRDSCLVPTRPDYRILPGHSGVAPFCREDWLALGDLRICSDRIRRLARHSLPTLGHTRPNRRSVQVTGLSSSTFHELMNLGAGVRRWRGL